MIDLTNFQAIGEYTLVEMVEPVEDINVIKIVQDIDIPTYISEGLIISVDSASYEDIFDGEHILFNKQKSLQIKNGNDNMYMVRSEDVYGKYTATEEI